MLETGKTFIRDAQFPKWVIIEAGQDLQSSPFLGPNNGHKRLRSIITSNQITEVGISKSNCHPQGQRSLSLTFILGKVQMVCLLKEA